MDQAKQKVNPDGVSDAPGSGHRTRVEIPAKREKGGNEVRHSD